MKKWLGIHSLLLCSCLLSRCGHEENISLPQGKGKALVQLLENLDSYKKEIKNAAKTIQNTAKDMPDKLRKLRNYANNFFSDLSTNKNGNVDKLHTKILEIDTDKYIQHAQEIESLKRKANKITAEARVLSEEAETFRKKAEQLKDAASNWENDAKEAKWENALKYRDKANKLRRDADHKIEQKNLLEETASKATKKAHKIIEEANKLQDELLGKTQKIGEEISSNVNSIKAALENLDKQRESFIEMEEGLEKLMARTRYAKESVSLAEKSKKLLAAAESFKTKTDEIYGKLKKPGLEDTKKQAKTALKTLEKEFTKLKKHGEEIVKYVEKALPVKAEGFPQSSFYVRENTGNLAAGISRKLSDGDIKDLEEILGRKIINEIKYKSLSEVADLAIRNSLVKYGKNMVELLEASKRFREVLEKTITAEKTREIKAALRLFKSEIGRLERVRDGLLETMTIRNKIEKIKTNIDDLVKQSQEKGDKTAGLVETMKASAKEAEHASLIRKDIETWENMLDGTLQEEKKLLDEILGFNDINAAQTGMFADILDNIYHKLELFNKNSTLEEKREFLAKGIGSEISAAYKKIHKESNRLEAGKNEFSNLVDAIENKTILSVEKNGFNPNNLLRTGVIKKIKSFTWEESVNFKEATEKILNKLNNASNLTGGNLLKTTKSLNDGYTEILNGSKHVKIKVNDTLLTIFSRGDVNRNTFEHGIIGNLEEYLKSLDNRIAELLLEAA